MLRTFYDMGYAVEWRVINAAEYGFPQKRRRVFIFAYHESTKYFDKMKRINNGSFIFKESMFAQLFKIKDDILDKGKTDISEEKYEDVVDVSDNFDFHFFNAGRMVNGNIYSVKVLPDYNDDLITLGDILEDSEVDEKFLLTGEKLEKWKYLKGSKKIERKRPNGETYCYSEGAIPFPDKLDVPARTMLTSESTTNRSSHVVKDKMSGKLRILTPVEAERINMFPDNWTNIDSEAMTERRRYFMMGNALVVGVVEKIGQYLEKIIDIEN